MGQELHYPLTNQDGSKKFCEIKIHRFHPDSEIRLTLEVGIEVISPVSYDTKLSFKIIYIQSLGRDK